MCFDTSTSRDRCGRPHRAAPTLCRRVDSLQWICNPLVIFHQRIANPLERDLSSDVMQLLTFSNF